MSLAKIHGKSLSPCIFEVCSAVYWKASRYISNVRPFDNRSADLRTLLNVNQLILSLCYIMSTACDRVYSYRERFHWLYCITLAIKLAYNIQRWSSLSINMSNETINSRENSLHHIILIYCEHMKFSLFILARITTLFICHLMINVTIIFYI